MKKIALFPGSFDPYTSGHHDIVMRALDIFDEVVIGIGSNSNKSRYFPIEVMTEKIKESHKGEKRVRVEVYSGLTASFAEQIGARYIVRGLRNTTDFEYENTIAQANKHVFSKLETVFLITSPELAFISSTIVRDLHKYGTDVSRFLPYSI